MMLVPATFLVRDRSLNMARGMEEKVGGPELFFH
jgi:hypothetical protein